MMLFPGTVKQINCIPEASARDGPVEHHAARYETDPEIWHPPDKLGFLSELFAVSVRPLARPLAGTAIT